MYDIAIIGAGPYGLSVAAHLLSRGLTVRVFGKTMETWRNNMPPGMMLKSEGFASNLSDPQAELTLEKYCVSQGLPYQHTGLPVPLATFIAYGQAFQQKFVPDVDSRSVQMVEKRPTGGFRLRLDDESVTLAHRIVIAAGIKHFAYLPAHMACPGGRVSHSADHGPLGRFSGQKVAVVGAGSSATDTAALLHQNGASVTLIARRSKLPFVGGPEQRTLAQRARAPLSGLGTGWRSLAACKAPLLFHRLPEEFRHLVVRKHLGPAPGYVTRTVIDNDVEKILAAPIKSVKDTGSQIAVEIVGTKPRVIKVDHVIAATGYRVDLRRLGFLDALRSDISCADHTPRLSTNFQSSVTGLYFVGASAANSFGPLLRFVYGADWTAHRIAHHLSRRVPVTTLDNEVAAELNMKPDDIRLA